MKTKTDQAVYRVVLVDDHAMVREGIRAIVERDQLIEVVGEASDGREGIELIEKIKPDIVVIDIGMPNLNGVDATRQLTRDFPKVKVIALSMHTDKRFVLAMFEAGAMGYVAKDSISEEIVRAIHAVAKGRKYISSDVAGPMIETATRQDPTYSSKEFSSVLGARERQVLQLLAEGMTSGEIAKQLSLSVHTIDTHRRNIMKKTQTHSVAELTKLAIREGLTSL
ncbi:MAG: response regulator transcription factor [Phycisphaerales bacterium]